MTPTTAPAPPLARPRPGECHVWTLPVRHRPEWLDVLTAAERARLDTLGDGPAAATHLTSRAVQRLIGSGYLGVPPAEIRIGRRCEHCGAGHGRPRWTGSTLDYSVSHAREWLVMAVVGDGRVGVDIDRLDPGQNPTALAAHTLTAAEARDFAALPAHRRPQAFLTAWTRKEAAMKLTGHGLAAPPSRIDVTGPTAHAPAVPAWPRDPVHLRPLPAPPGHTAALATTHPVTSISPSGLPWA
ncbi:4'-phosphopantetheinyl transferase superfamily protein [Streptomyces sp. PTM05]|uniref:4'-phosphopantetheinyl transferase superfamily protein n=1 Tax=Streptantibioticus parmotrematis TaxID=2873249 RepID=A0ABS7QQ70_9ACTN|nr:4'-phosphopantetheinyl transferase superfamily protein [Streptantibioticus parmotrematis]MBY8885325.1 4'-phosphopantetheinyl transferase superfamily protein [Streptantibioticus parmotrematis]